MPSILANWSRLWEEQFQSDDVLEDTAVIRTRAAAEKALEEAARPQPLLFSPSFLLAIYSFCSFPKTSQSASWPEMCLHPKHHKVREWRSHGNSKNGAGVSEELRQECHDPVWVMSISPLMGNRQWRFVFLACESILKVASWRQSMFCSIAWLFPDGGSMTNCVIRKIGLERTSHVWRRM